MTREDLRAAWPDYPATHDISDAEFDRIAEAAEDVADAHRIWADERWWRVPTAAEIAVQVRAYAAANQERMKRRPAGVPRAAWRSENPVTRPETLRLGRGDGRVEIEPDWASPKAHDMWVWAADDILIGAAVPLRGHLDLTADDADDRLGRLAAATTAADVQAALA